MLATAGVLALPVGVRAADPSVTGAELCTPEEYRWSGVLELSGGGAVATTDVDVPEVPGTWLRVVGTSADGLDTAGSAHAVAVTVGASAADPGASIVGGAIGVRALDDVPVVVNGVTLVVDRCRTVAAAPPGALPAASAGTDAANDDLPAAGGASATLIVIGGVLALGSGVGVWAVSRRRHC